jgi:hypothetical protein
MKCREVLSQHGSRPMAKTPRALGLDRRDDEFVAK